MDKEDFIGAVINLDGDNEFVVTPAAAQQIERQEQVITLRRLFDHSEIDFPLKDVLKALQTPVDKIDATG